MGRGSGRGHAWGWCWCASAGTACSACGSARLYVGVVVTEGVKRVHGGHDSYHASTASAEGLQGLGCLADGTASAITLSYPAPPGTVRYSTRYHQTTPPHTKA